MRFFLIGILLFLAGCGREPLYQSQSYVFGTLVDISIYGMEESSAREVANHVAQQFQALHNKLHAWQPNSELSKLNQAFAEGRSTPIDAELAEIIANATALSVQSNGLFNPAIGHLIQQWGFQRDEFTPVKIDPEAIAALVKSNPRMTGISIKESIASSSNPAVKLDLGGYAKGYALDKAAAYLHSQGVKNALINIGGNIIALGQHGKQPWRVGIQHPRKPCAIATLDLPDGWAIGTSGDYQRYFELDGKRYCHVIDPLTGYPAQGTQAITVLIPPGKHVGILSDVASKPIFISNNKAEAAKSMGVENVLVIDANGRILVSESMVKRLQWVEKNVPFEKLF